MSTQTVISYHTAITGSRRPVTPQDVCDIYSTFEEAQAHYHYEDNGDSAILANINDEWYRVCEFGCGIRYKKLNCLFGDWHSLEEIVAGIDISNIPFKNMLAIAAATAYCNGTLAEAIGASQNTLRGYEFYEKFTEYFGKPMSEFRV